MNYPPPHAILYASGHLSDFRESHVLPKPLFKPILSHDMQRSVVHPPYLQEISEEQGCCEKICESKCFKSILCCCCCYYLFYDD